MTEFQRKENHPVHSRSCRCVVDIVNVVKGKRFFLFEEAFDLRYLGQLFPNLSGKCHDVQTGKEASSGFRGGVPHDPLPHLVELKLGGGLLPAAHKLLPWREAGSKIWICLKCFVISSFSPEAPGK